VQSHSKVSVVIPTFKGAHVVVEAVQSVVVQTHPDIELTVVDDGSTDETRTVLSAFADRISVCLSAECRTSRSSQ
jgi:glycosyltransferase involved in cell wall biosynthesis